jgi:hypothetical protein
MQYAACAVLPLLLPLAIRSRFISLSHSRASEWRLQCSSPLLRLLPRTHTRTLWHLLLLTIAIAIAIICLFHPRIALPRMTSLHSHPPSSRACTTHLRSSPAGPIAADSHITVNAFRHSHHPRQDHARGSGASDCTMESLSYRVVHVCMHSRVGIAPMCV